ncbi:MAG: protein kinase [Gemmatimonadaceae bacterium]|nr:protein kinase [Gemmatimonadaceae bacterium]
MPLRDELQNALGASYTIERELGGGGMSHVFLADDVKLGRHVVIKVLPPELAESLSAARFAREIRVAASLQQANIVPLLDAGEAMGLPYFTMPYVDGESLRAKLATSGRLPVSEAMSILRDVVRALSYAHQHGLAHRDIKPDNILLSHGTAMVTDFGIAKAITEARQEESITRARQHDRALPTLTGLGVSIGTPAYMAPEQVAGDPNIDHRADIYAVGVLAYEMISGHPPFTGTPQSVMAAHVTTEPPALVLKRSDVPTALAQLTMKCLAKEPGNRYATADELLADIEHVARPSVPVLSPAARRKRRSTFLIAAAAVTAMLALGWFGSASTRRERWARRTAIPELQRLVNAEQLDSALALAREVVAILPNDTSFASLYARFTRVASITSEPAGAKVYRASFDDTTRWTLLGTTPIDSILLPFRYGLLRAEKPGFRPVRGMMFFLPIHLALDSVTAPDSDMVHIAAGTFAPFLVGLEEAPPLALGDYRIDRHEITNRQYRSFVAAGGYTKREFWDRPFDENGRVLTWEQAMTLFKDKTGRAGPATWEAGDFPSGEADFPVSGVSWYEAAAYATFAGKSLPTIYDWGNAATAMYSPYIAARGNMESASPVAVGTKHAPSAVGVEDMAGNVREWCLNAADQGQRYILGGGWSDPTYSFTNAYAQPAMDRSVINGIRLVRHRTPSATLAQSMQPQRTAFRDYSRERPVSDAAFAGFRQMYDYDHTPLNPKLELRDTNSTEWVVERVSYAAAYGNERMSAWIFLPIHGSPPYQTVVFFPGSFALESKSSMERRHMTPSFVVKSGRAFVLPIYKSTYERHDTLHNDLPDTSVMYRDHVVMWAKDYRRTLDYLSTRADIDSNRFAYFGESWGGKLGGLVPAVEPRLKAIVLVVAGLGMQRARPEADVLNFLPHIKAPTLMLNGKYDFFFPTESSQRPFFRLLGTAADQKKYIVYEYGHVLPRTQLISETLAWLDRYLGPVR